MPFINVKVAGPKLDATQVSTIQTGITSLMADVLKKKAELTAVFVEESDSAHWTVGARTGPRFAHVDAIVTDGTNTSEEKAAFIAQTHALLRKILGVDLHDVTYVVIHDVPKDSWGYGGLTQAERARRTA